MFMEGTEYRFEDGSKVKLRGIVGPEFYGGLAKVGNEGWITQHRRDRHGLPEVYIQWDRLHWADNRQPDGWTFEDHFDLVRKPDNMPNESEPTPEQLMKLWNFFQTMNAGDPAEALPDPEPDDPKVDAHASIAANAKESIDLGESFLAISVIRNEPTEEAPKGPLEVLIHGHSLTPESEIIMGMQLSKLGVQFHHEAAISAIENLASTGSDSD